MIAAAIVASISGSIRLEVGIRFMRTKIAVVVKAPTIKVMGNEGANRQKSSCQTALMASIAVT